MKHFLLTLTMPLALFAQDAFQVKVTGHGQPMILIPGLSSSGEVWDTTVARYQDRYECHVFTIAGFAGVPRVPAPMLDHVTDALAAYIRDKKLVQPIIVGHSLGGYWAMAIGSKYPDLVGKLVIVDAYPFTAGMMDASVTPEQAKASAAQMRQYMGSQSQDMYERYVKSGMATRPMVTKDADLERIIGWGLASDRTAVSDAMGELFAADLRDSIANIKSPTLVLATWIGYKDYTDRATIDASVKRQYAKLAGVEIRITDTARHFIMWDDPDWMFAQLDSFLGIVKSIKRQ